MTVKLASKTVVLAETQTIEHSLTLDGVIELPESCEAEEFFDGLLDVIIEYVEQYDGLAALGMKHKRYEEDEAQNDEVEHGGKGA
jgi:hypothetical protein